MLPLTHTQLSVNINKIALLRNARGGNVPNLLQFATDCQTFGAQGITIHPRPDERHIRYADAYALKPIVSTEFNIEGYPSPDFLKMVLEIQPTQCTLVPDAANVLTSNEGWDTIAHQSLLKDIVSQLNSKKIRTALFVEPNPQMVEYAARTGAHRIELYTGHYAHQYPQNPQQAIHAYQIAANTALQCNIGINAGHDLNLQNLKFFKQNIPALLEVSIGHALTADALYLGIENTIQLYLRQLNT